MRTAFVATICLSLGCSAEALAQCTIEYEQNRCGFASSGSWAYAKNNSRSHSYRITTRMDKNGSFFRNDVNRVSAGDRAIIGCTSGDGTDYYKFTVTGCEQLN